MSIHVYRSLPKDVYEILPVVREEEIREASSLGKTHSALIMDSAAMSYELRTVRNERDAILAIYGAAGEKGDYIGTPWAVASQLGEEKYILSLTKLAISELDRFLENHRFLVNHCRAGSGIEEWLEVIGFSLMAQDCHAGRQYFVKQRVEECASLQPPS